MDKEKEEGCTDTMGCNIVKGLLSVKYVLEAHDDIKASQLITYLNALDQPHIITEVEEKGLPSRIVISHHLATDKVKDIFSMFAEVRVTRLCDKPTILFLWEGVSIWDDIV